MPSFANCKAGAGHVYSNENGETSIVTSSCLKLRPIQGEVCAELLTSRDLTIDTNPRRLSGNSWRRRAGASGSRVMHARRPVGTRRAREAASACRICAVGKELFGRRGSRMLSE